jgi:enoyl-CoA hydratase
VTTVTVDAPPVNAMGAQVLAALHAAARELQADAETRAVVLTGTGDKAFMAGADITELRKSTMLDGLAAGMQRLYDEVENFPKPTIAAVNGAAVGAGLCLALACDLRYAAEDAKLVAPFTRLGIHPGMAATYLLPEAAGLPLAREMLFTGRTVTGAEAAAAGLVNRAVARENVVEEAMGAARAIAERAPLATRLTKAALADGGQPSLEAALRWEALAQPVTMASADLVEGLAALREKRTPNFTGR